MTDDLTPPPSDMIRPEEWQQTPTSVQNWIGELVAEVKQLRETVEQLQEIEFLTTAISRSPRTETGQRIIRANPVIGVIIGC